MEQEQYVCVCLRVCVRARASELLRKCLFLEKFPLNKQNYNKKDLCRFCIMSGIK